MSHRFQASSLVPRKAVPVLFASLLSALAAGQALPAADRAGGAEADLGRVYGSAWWDADATLVPLTRTSLIVDPPEVGSTSVL